MNLDLRTSSNGEGCAREQAPGAGRHELFSHRLRPWLPLVAVALLLIVYAFTMAPTLSWEHHGADGGDLVTAVARGGVPHPPGFPTYLLLGELFIRLPWGDPAWRLTLLSAVAGALAAGCTAAAASYTVASASFRLGRERAPSGSGPLVALAAGLSLGLAPLFWAQALIAEVYGPAALFAALVVLLALRGGPTWALGLAWGLGMGLHPTLVFLAPLVLQRSLGGPTGGRRICWLAAVGLPALTVVALLYGPMLVARGGAWSPWADLSTGEGWWSLVSARLYRGYVFALPLYAWPRRLLGWAGIVVRQFTPLGALLAALGWGALWRERPAFAGASLLSFAALSLYAIGYDTADSLVYLAPGLPLAALWLARGLEEAARWLARRRPSAAGLILLLPLVQIVLFWGAMDLSGDSTALMWAEGVLEEAPLGAVLLTAQDAHTFTLWYAHHVLGRRPDLVILDRDLWGQPSYREMVCQSLELDKGVSRTDLSPAEAARRAGRPLVHVEG